MPEASEVVKNLPPYPFQDLEEMVAGMRERGIDVTDFSIGDPKEPTPVRVRRAAKKAIDDDACAGYPSNIGSPLFRGTVAYWMQKRFGVSLDPKMQVAAAIGAKEAVFNLPDGFLNVDDLIICCNPGYPPSYRGAQFSKGKVHYVPLLEENRFIPRLEEIPAEVLKEAKMFYVNYPNNPTTAMATRKFFEDLYQLANQYGIVVISDEAYSEMYDRKKPMSMLEVGMKNILIVQSLSKRSNMTNYRIGWIAGDADLMQVVKKHRSNINSGPFSGSQAGAIAALGSEWHVGQMRSIYRKKRKIMLDALREAGFPESNPEATFYIWQRVPDGYTSKEMAQKLLDPAIATAVTPGSALAVDVNGINPGEGYIRIALVPTVEETRKATERMVKNLNL